MDSHQLSFPSFTCAADCDFATDRTREHLLHHVRQHIPTVIESTERDLLPYRADFLDQSLAPGIAATVAQRAPLIFMPSDIRESRPYDDYVMYLFGALFDGTKVKVMVTDIPLTLDIEVEPNGQPWDSWFRERRIWFLPNPTRIWQYRLIGFQRKKSEWMRFTFRTLKDRANAINEINAENESRKAAAAEGKGRPQPQINLAGDDRSNYFNKVARNYRFRTAGWNRITNYDVVDPEAEVLRLANEAAIAAAAAKEDSSSYGLRAEADRANRRYTAADVEAKEGCTRDVLTLRVSINNFQRVDKEKHAQLMAVPAFAAAMEKDKTMTAQWDIETHQRNNRGRAPRPEDKDYEIFSMGSSYFWHWSTEPLLTVCAQISREALPRAGIDITINCATEREMMLSDIEIKSRMRFDILCAFNGGVFDWPIYHARLRAERLLGWLRYRLSLIHEPVAGGADNITITAAGRTVNVGPTGNPDELDKIGRSVSQWSFAAVSVKIAPDTYHDLDMVARIPGWVDTDAMPTFLKLYSKMEVRKTESLNYFLEKNKLPAKEDMPITRMFRIYERSRRIALVAPARECHCAALCMICTEHIPALDDVKTGAQRCCHCSGRCEQNLRDMADVAYYCVVDGIRPQQLYVARAIIYDKRELSSMSYVSLYDSFYRADGMKVRNVIGSYCTRYGIAYPAQAPNRGDSEKIHYPGAHVFPPVRGLNNELPLTGLDFASLYPSLMMTYNISPDMLIESRKEAEALVAEGYTLHHIGPVQCEVGAEKGMPTNQSIVVEAWTVRHNGVINRPLTHTVEGHEREYPKRDTHTVERYRRLEKSNDDWTATREFVSCGATITDRDAPSTTTLELTPSNDTADYKYEPVLGRAALPGERMGIFSYIVRKLFEKRVPIKRLFVHLESIIEEAETRGERFAQYDGAQYSLDELRFIAAKVNAKQSAIKILANTYYGETGNFRSAIYAIAVAAGITDEGQNNIKGVHAFIESLGFDTKYGDTDSLYLTCPEHFYADVRAQYNRELAEIAARTYDVAAARALIAAEPAAPQWQLAVATDPDSRVVVEMRRRDRLAARLRCWTVLVQITMRVVADLRNRVNEWLLANNGTRFLNMAYEEVGFPSVLCGKKKYFLTPHIKEVNFRAKPMIRGIDIVKQGKSKLMVAMGHEIIAEVLAPENERALFDISVDKIRRCHSQEWPLEFFTQTARYRPDKNNVPVLKFVARMIQMQARYASDESQVDKFVMYSPPDAGDKFTYVEVEKEQQWTPAGQRITMTKGDYMEYDHVYTASQSSPAPMRINLARYMQGAVIGLLSRFIAYAPQFQPSAFIGYMTAFTPAASLDTALPETRHRELTVEQYELLDAECVKAAAKYLNKINDEVAGTDRGALRDIGTAYRALYVNTRDSMCVDLADRYGYCAAVLADISIVRAGERIDYDATMRGVEDYCDYVAAAHHDRELGKATQLSSTEVWRRNVILLRRIEELRADMRRRADHLVELLLEYEMRFIGYIDAVRLSGAEISYSINDLSTAQQEVITWFGERMREVIACQMSRIELAARVRAATTSV